MARLATPLPPLLLLLLVLLASCAGPAGKRAAAPDAPTPGKVHIRYQYQAADLENLPAAFNVYRSNVAAGPFAQINTSPIRAARSPRPGETQLLLTDTAVDLGKTYFYYIETVMPDGRARKATGIVRATVNLPLNPGETRAAKSPAAGD